MNKGIVLYLVVFLSLIILFIGMERGKKNYYIVEGKIIQITNEGDFFSVAVETCDGGKAGLKFWKKGNGRNFTSRLGLLLEQGDLIKVQVLESEGEERTARAILSVK